MSVAFLADRSQSRFTTRHLHDAAAKLNVEIPDGSEAEDYLHLLQSAEAVMTHIETSADYIHPALVPVETTAPRVYWKPGIRDEKDDNPLNAWSHRCEIAAARPTSQLLFGRSIAIKDNVTIGGLPTTVGTFPELLSRDGDGRDLPVSPIDATVVSRLVAAGAVIKGSSTCENYCASPLSYSAASGPVDNPWLHGYTAGGSSSGSAALVAATVLAQKGTERSFGETVDLAIGSDQGGSIRIPASFNGIYGLKPTYGLIPYTGAVSLSPMIDHLGPLATNLEDIARLLFVMAGYDSLDPRMTPESPLRDQVKDYPRLLAEYRTSTSTINTSTIGKSERTRLRVGLLMEAFDAPGLTEEVRDTVLQAAKDSFTAAGADVVNISIPMHCEGPLIWTAATRMSMSEWACQGKTSGHLSFLPPHVQPRWPPDQRMYDLITATNPAAMNVMLSGPFLQDHFGPAVEAKAHRKVFELRAAYDRVFEGEEEEKVDVLVTPCAPTVAMPHPKMNADDAGPRSTVMEKLMVAVGVTSNTAPFNATGHPALSVPCGYGSAGSEAGVRLPIGMQVVGKRWDDEMVLKAAVVFEAGNELLRS